jgi:hypothetical protein
LDANRFQGVFDDDMGVVIAHRTYNFTLLDRVWDHLVALELKPIIELSFMPAVLANCSWLGPRSGSCHDDVTAPCTNIRPGCDNGAGGLVALQFAPKCLQYSCVALFRTPPLHPPRLFF